MTVQVGRNEPCPCGSGKKYKHCHLRRDEASFQPAPPKAHDGTIELALAWLTRHHRKALRVAYEALLDSVMPPEADIDPARMDEDFSNALQLNLTEWLLAEGEMLVKGELQPIGEYLLGPAGPGFGKGQRRWLERMTSQPLLLYTVTDVAPGATLTLCDALDGEAEPVVVQERMGSRSLTPGMLIAARVLPVDEHHELSGAVYQFSMFAAPDAMARVQAAGAGDDDSGGRRTQRSIQIAICWAEQFYAAPKLPRLVDTSSGEALLLITDHYRVNDGSALTAALAACPDVEGDAERGWSRLVEDDDKAMRPIVSVNPGKTAERIEVFYKAQGQADAGRAWFDALAGTAVKFLTREISDPRALMSKAVSGQGHAPTQTGLADVAPEVLTQAVEQAMRRSYTRWADEPIAALGHKTPREAIRSSAGLERVKGLLRSYEEGEDESARTQGRPSISYRFLWDELGIAP